jgi:hypothetical protein
VCALALLSLTASEAAVERSFSRQNIIHGKLRNSLSGDSVQTQMFIAFHKRALENAMLCKRKRKEEEEEEEDGAKKVKKGSEAKEPFTSSIFRTTQKADPHPARAT